MTIAQQLEQKGEQKGLQKGKQIAERDTRLEIARNMLESGFDWASVMKMTGLTEQDRQHIKH
ncbi:putative cytoplasmic protein [Pantoea sp. AS-PWVM4]|nr:putative cytoplasmic protein [Pantoea sp. AS-PWVM4]